MDGLPESEPEHRYPRISDRNLARRPEFPRTPSQRTRKRVMALHTTALFTFSRALFTFSQGASFASSLPPLATLLISLGTVGWTPNVILTPKARAISLSCPFSTSPGSHEALPSFQSCTLPQPNRLHVRTMSMYPYLFRERTNSKSAFPLLRSAPSKTHGMNPSIHTYTHHEGTNV